MKMLLRTLLITTRRTTERIEFSDTCTFLYGPVGTGKSTVARLIDYCLGGGLERTPAIQQEFVAAQLSLTIGDFNCKLERSSTDNQSVRVTWSRNESDIGSVNAPLSAGDDPIFRDDIYNLSDLLFHLGGITPIKVRKRAREADSPLIRLSFRDIWSYCYLEQTHLDSSFFRLEDPFRGRKSQDAMRFFTGLHSERLSELENELWRSIEQQQGKREAARQIRQFMSQFELDSELDVAGQIARAQTALANAESRRRELEHERTISVHPTDELRDRLRALGSKISEFNSSIIQTEEAISEQKALKAELIMTKVKADRVEQAGHFFDNVAYVRCPECGTDVSQRVHNHETCRLCCSVVAAQSPLSSLEMEAVRREINDRIDQVTDSISRRKRTLEQSKRQLIQLRAEKESLDLSLQRELARYDSAFVESIRGLDRETATLSERIRSLTKLQEMPRAINELEDQAGALQGSIDRLRASIDTERARLRLADANIAALAQKFKSIVLSVGFPGVVAEDEVIIDPRNWRPTIAHGEQLWSFDDAGSGGKKTLFNVCYALAVQETARQLNLPVPTILIVDSPTKNISDDENPELVKALYREIYRIAASINNPTQFVIIDSDLVEPEDSLAGFSKRHIAGTPEDPSLIPYYQGP